MIGRPKSYFVTVKYKKDVFVRSIRSRTM